MKPLDGVRVIEAASYISGPFGSMILADLGAEVIKVEPPGKGDPYRRFGARYGDSSLFFKAANQNKTSVFLNLKDPAGMDEFRSLLADADVLITNWRPSVAPGLGLSAEVVEADFPQLVWVRVSGYGQDGPMADMPAYDSIVQSRSGALRAGQDQPKLMPSLLADKVSAMTAAQAATAALLQRESTGRGSICDVAMIDAMAYFNAPDVAAGHRFVDDPADPRIVDQLGGNQPLRTKDSWITLSPVSGAQFRRSLEVVGRADAWEELIAKAGAGEMYGDFATLMAAEMVKRSTAEWEHAFREADVPATAVMTLEEHMADNQIAHNGTYTIVDEPGIGPYRRVRYPALFDGSPAETANRTTPPLVTEPA